MKHLLLKSSSPVNFNEEVIVDRFPFMVGRHTECDHLLSHMLISRRHCRLVCAGDAVSIEDLGSRNGTFLNGDRLRGSRTLAEGDEIGLGYFLYRVSFVSTN